MKSNKPSKPSRGRQDKEKVAEDGDVPSYAKTYLLSRKTSLPSLSPPSNPSLSSPALGLEDLTREKMRSLVPCVGSERLREYVDFINEGNFYPLTVLDPELGNH